MIRSFLQGRQPRLRGAKPKQPVTASRAPHSACCFAQGFPPYVPSLSLSLSPSHSPCLPLLLYPAIAIAVKSSTTLRGVNHWHSLGGVNHCSLQSFGKIPWFDDRGVKHGAAIGKKKKRVLDVYALYKFPGYVKPITAPYFPLIIKPARNLAKLQCKPQWLTLPNSHYCYLAKSRDLMHRMT